MEPIQVRPRFISYEEAPLVADIEWLCFPDPWSEQKIKEFIDHRGTIGLIADYETMLVGYILYEPTDHRIDIHRMAVLPRFQQRTVGTQLIHRMIDKLYAQSRKNLTAKVPDTNLDAQLFFQAMQFIAARPKPNDPYYTMIFGRQPSDESPS